MASKVAELYAEIRLEQTRLNSEITGLRGKLTSQMSSIGDMAGRQLTAGITSRLRGITDSIFSLKGMLVGGAIGVGATSLVSRMVGNAADLEQTQVALTTMLRSAERANAVLADVRQFAADTPFELPELADSTKKLLAFGSSSETVVDELRMIGDVSSGVGQRIGEIAEIYGKARVQGRLFAEDINQLTGRGIPIIQALAKNLGVADSQVKAMVESGKIGFPDLEKAFRTMTSEGGQFAGMMQAQSQTLAGQWAKLTDELNAITTQLGTAMMPLLKELLATAGAIAPIFTEWVQSFTGVEDAAAGAENRLTTIHDLMAGILDFAQGIHKAFLQAQLGLTTLLAGMAQSAAFFESDNPAGKFAARQLPVVGGMLTAADVAGIDMRVLAEELQREAEQLHLKIQAVESAPRWSDRMRENLKPQAAPEAAGPGMLSSAITAANQGAASWLSQQAAHVSNLWQTAQEHASNLRNTAEDLAKQAQQNFESLKQEADSIIQANLTKEERFAQGQKRAEFLRDMGLLTPEQFRRQMNVLQDNFGDGEQRELRTQLFGSSDQFWDHLQQSLTAKEDAKERAAQDAMINAAQGIKEIVQQGLKIKAPVEIKNPQPARAT